MSTHEHTGIIHIDFYLHRALLTQSFNHSRLRSFIACIALRVVNRLLTVTLDISAFRLGSQMRQDNRWRTKRPTIDQPFIPASQLIWHWAFNDGFNIYPINEYNTGGAFIQITSITSSLSSLVFKKIWDELVENLPGAKIVCLIFFKETQSKKTDPRTVRADLIRPDDNRVVGSLTFPTVNPHLHFFLLMISSMFLNLKFYVYVITVSFNYFNLPDGKSIIPMSLSSHCSAEEASQRDKWEPSQFQSSLLLLNKTLL